MVMRLVRSNLTTIHNVVILDSKIMKIKKVNLTKTVALKEVSLLDKNCFPHDNPEPKIGDWWILWDDDVAVGFIGGKFQNNYYRLTRIGIIKEYRGRGLAHRLLRVLIRYSKHRNHKGIRTYTSYDNTSSINTLIHHGFKMTGVMNQNNSHFIKWQLLFKGLKP